MLTKLKAPSGTLGAVSTPFGNYAIDADGYVTVDSRAVDALVGAGFNIINTLRTVGGSHVTTSGEAAANMLSIDTGLDAITGVVVQVLNAGNNVVTTDADITTLLGVIIVADGATYNTVAGQIINWIAVGTGD